MKPRVVALGTTMAANVLITKLLHCLESWAMTVPVSFLCLFKQLNFLQRKVANPENKPKRFHTLETLLPIVFFHASTC